MKRSTSWLVCSVVAAHGIAVCLVLLIQGCGTPITPDGRSSSHGVSSAHGHSTTTVAPVPAARRTMPPRASTRRAPVKPRPVVRRTPVVVPSPRIGETSEYVVQKGDSLSMIAMRFNVKVAEIMALNQIKKANLIRVGQKLMLPGKVNMSAPKPVVRSTAKPKVTASGDKHVVKPGDTLSQIAVDYGIKIADLQSANGIKSHVIYVGQSLVVPGATRKPAAVAHSPEPKKPEPKKPDPVVVPPAVADGGGSADIVVPPPVADIPEPPANTGSTEAGTSEIPLTMHTHEVKDGEDLYSVSLIWDVSIDELKRINDLSGTDLTPGQVLRIPRVE